MFCPIRLSSDLYSHSTLDFVCLSQLALHTNYVFFQNRSQSKTAVKFTEFSIFKVNARLLR